MLLTCFIMLISGTFFGLFTHAIGTITLLTTPSLLCEQDVVEFNCTLSSGITYTGSVASLSINGSTSCFTGPSIFNGAVPRLSFTSIGGNATAPAAQYTISPFLRQDNATQYRCCADNSASPFNTLFTSNLSLSLAALPSPPTILNISSTFDSASSCNGTITLTWPAVISDRDVTNYTVYLNGTNLDGSTITATYTTGSLNLLEHYANYTVVATSCAGSSMASYPAMFTPLSPASPYPAIISINITYNPPTSCTGTITLTWLEVIADRNVTSYTVLLNGTTNVTTLSPTTGTNTYTTSNMSLATFNARYTVRAVNCVGSSVSNEVVFTSPTPPYPASISISTTYDSAISCYGTITLTWPAVIADRNVTSYEVNLNGMVNATITTTMAMNTHTTSNMSLATFNGNYTVRAVNCVGSSVSNEVVFTSPTIPSIPAIAASPNITSLQPSSCTARIAYTLQQPADSRNVTSYYLSTASTVIQTLSAKVNNMYSFYYDVILNTAANLYITAENCVGNSSQLQTTLPMVQGVSIVDFDISPALIIDGNFTYTLLFPADYVFEVNYTLYATATYKNGNTDTRAIFTAVQNTNIMILPRNIAFQILFDAAFALPFTDVDNISVMVAVNSQCGQALNISSMPKELRISSSTTSTTTAIVTTTTNSTSLQSTTITTATPNPEAQACGIGCDTVVGIAIGAIVILLLIIGAILAIIGIIICCRRRSKNNVKYTNDSGLYYKDTPTTSVRNEMEMTPSYNDDMPTYAQINKSIKKPPKSQPNELIYAEMDFSKDLPKPITESPNKPVIAETIYSMVTAPLDDSTGPQMYPNLDTAYQGAQYTPSSLYSNVS